MDRELPVSPWPEWQIIEKVGEGSFGTVYKAERTERGHSFYSAIKIITIPSSREELNSVRQETGDENTTRKYFENVMEECIKEVSTMENFRGNSHVVSVEDFKVTEYLDEIGWDVFIRMEYLTSFLDYCAERTLTERNVLKLGADLCKALDYCRRLNIVHRDIKPENIFVSRFGDFKLGDFGIAKELERSASSFSKKGTYSYMAPEVYRGESYDERADIYSLGLVMYRLMNRNRLPFLDLDKQLITYRDKEKALSHRMAGEEFPPPAEAGEGFAAVVRKACAFAPEDRYANVAEFQQDINRLRRGQNVQPFPKAVSVAAREAVEASKAAEGDPELAYEKVRQQAHEEQEQNRQEKEARRAEQRAREKAEAERRSMEIRSSAESRRRERRREESRHWKRLAITAFLILALVAAAVPIAGHFLKQMVENTVREQSQQMVTTMEEDQTRIASMDDGGEYADALQLIRDRTKTIVSSQDSYVVEGEEGARCWYYDDDGNLRKVVVYPEYSSENCYEEYYYWNDIMFFAYIWNDDANNMYYYQDGMLIRWIDEDGITHENEEDNPEYMERGDRYWLNSLLEMGG